MIAFDNKTYDTPKMLIPRCNNWDNLFMYQYLPVDFIRDYKDKLNWYLICRYNQMLTEEDLIEFKDCLYWDVISKHQKLSENFCEKFSDRLNITSIVPYQNVSDEFITKFKDKIDWENIPINKIQSSNTMGGIVLTIPDVFYELCKILKLQHAPT